MTTFDEVLGDLATGAGVRRKRWDKDSCLFYHYEAGDFIKINKYIEYKNITKTIPLTMEDLVADDWEVVEGRLIATIDYKVDNVEEECEVME